jgi:beta-lactam-binding protein with PASTA domain
MSSLGGSQLRLAVGGRRPKPPVRVPDLVGLSSYDASGLLREVGLRPGLLRFERSRRYEAGIVIGQDPSPKSLVPRRSPVELTVSSGRLK